MSCEIYSSSAANNGNSCFGHLYWRLRYFEIKLPLFVVCLEFLLQTISKWRYFVTSQQFVKTLHLLPSLLGVKIHTGLRRNGILDWRSLCSSVLIGILHSIIVALRYWGAKCLVICCWDLINSETMYNFQIAFRLRVQGQLWN